MEPAAGVTIVAHVIQQAVAPVFLLTGIGAILAVLINRLARVVDHFRVLERTLHEAREGEHHAHRAEMARLSRRSRLIQPEANHRRCRWTHRGLTGAAVTKSISLPLEGGGRGWGCEANGKPGGPIFPPPSPPSPFQGEGERSSPRKRGAWCDSRLGSAHPISPRLARGSVNSGFSSDLAREAHDWTEPSPTTLSPEITRVMAAPCQPKPNGCVVGAER